MKTSRWPFTGTELRLWSETVVIVVFCLQAVGCSVMPQNVNTNGSRLTWAAGPGDNSVLYTVEYQRYANSTWQQVPSCVQMPHTSCDFSSVQGCVALRVRAQEHGVLLPGVPACSTQGGLCSPEVSLTAAPGIIKVNLKKEHQLHDLFADSIQYRIHYGKEGEELIEFEDTLSSKTFSDLEVGQRYCVRVKFILYAKPIGVPSCVHCELVPAQSTTKKTVIITSVVVGVVVLVVVTVMFYLLIFQRDKIKKLLKPYEIVNLLPDLPARNEHRDLLPLPSEEPCDVISSMVPAASPSGLG